MTTHQLDTLLHYRAIAILSSFVVLVAVHFFIGG